MYRIIADTQTIGKDTVIKELETEEEAINYKNKLEEMVKNGIIEVQGEIRIKACKKKSKEESTLLTPKEKEKILARLNKAGKEDKPLSKEELDLIAQINEKYYYYSAIIKRNRLDTGHSNYCNKTDHRSCGANWGHADILREIIGRLLWWLTGEQICYVRVSCKPKLQSIMEQIFIQRGERELKGAEYSWLMQIISRCKWAVGKRENKKHIKRAKK